MKAFESLKGLLCDPEGKVCIAGTDVDRDAIQRHLNDAGKMVDMNTSLTIDNNYLREQVAQLKSALTMNEMAYNNNKFVLDQETKSSNELRQQLTTLQSKAAALVDALNGSESLITHLMPGVRFIALQDYAELNNVPPSQ